MTREPAVQSWPDAGRDRLGVGVVEHDHRRFAAELEVDALERVGRVPGDRLAGRDVAGERDEPDVGMRDEALADGDAVSRDDAEDAGGKDVLSELREAEQRQRRLLRRLEDLAVACGERGAELPDRHHERVVPRADARDDPERLAPDHRRVAGDVLACRLSLEMPCRPCEEAQVVGRERHLVARGHQRLAHVARLELRELLRVFLEHVGELVQELRALLRCRVEPRGQRLRRARDRAIDVLGAAARNLGDDLAGRRIDHLHRLAGGGVDEFAADEALVGRGGGAHACLLDGGDLR
jgi:ParB family chromosome partitioning protein